MRKEGWSRKGREEGGEKRRREGRRGRERNSSIHVVCCSPIFV